MSLRQYIRALSVALSLLVIAGFPCQKMYGLSPLAGEQMPEEEDHRSKQTEETRGAATRSPDTSKVPRFTMATLVTAPVIVVKRVLGVPRAHPPEFSMRRLI